MSIELSSRLLDSGPSIRKSFQIISIFSIE
nr:MAG TPA: hypothetical protein [Caudoviricetes sp.]